MNDRSKVLQRELVNEWAQQRKEKLDALLAGLDQSVYFSSNAESLLVLDDAYDVVKVPRDSSWPNIATKTVQQEELNSLMEQAVAKLAGIRAIENRAPIGFGRNPFPYDEQSK
jgi:hypothetical protein